MEEERHAYLILCHHNFRQLCRLLELLDDERNDIYVHVNKKSRGVPFDNLRSSVKRSRLYFVKPVRISWGGYSITRAELLLLKAATQTRHAYYHLISGVDLPLKTQDEIHGFFRDHAGREYVTFDREASETREFLDRISVYHVFQDVVGRDSGLAPAVLRRLERFLIKAQKRLGVNRLGNRSDLFYKGDNWFSITHAFANYILSQEPFIKRYFRWSFVPDEIFPQTLAMNSPFRERLAPDSPESAAPTRFIDWERGRPYTFTAEDYDLLMSSGRLFARKFDETADNEIIMRIYAQLKAED